MDGRDSSITTENRIGTLNMDVSESTAKLVDTTYKNILEEFAPCTKQLVVAGKAYLKSLQGMVGASRLYTDALARVAGLALNSTLGGSRDIGAALEHLVAINKELLTQQANIMKSLEFDFLEPIEITADKDGKLIGKEQKRFQQLYKGRRENFMKCISTLKKSKRKKSTNIDKQLAQIRMMEEAKNRLEEFCDISLKEAIVEERSMYGTVLERQCALNKQLLIYHTKGCELLQNHLPDWDCIAQSRKTFPSSCITMLSENFESEEYCQNNEVESIGYEEAPIDGSVKSSPQVLYGMRHERHSTLTNSWHNTISGDEIYAKPMVRAKSDYHLPTSPSSSTSGSGSPSANRLSRIIEYNGEMKPKYVQALYTFVANGDHQMSIEEGDIIEFKGSHNMTGWQFGENLTSKRSGWFPLSYTEVVRDGLRPSVTGSAKLNTPDSTRDISNSVSKSDNGLPRNIPVPPPPPLPATVSSVRSKSQHLEPSEYGIPNKLMQKKPLPVEPPNVSVSQLSNDHSHGQFILRRHHASQPNISDSVDSIHKRKQDGIYWDGRHLPSMQL